MTIGQEAGEFAMAVNADGSIAWQRGSPGATVVHVANSGVYAITLSNPRVFKENMYTWFCLGNSFDPMNPVIAVAFLASNDYQHFTIATADVTNGINLVDLAWFFRITEA